MKEERLPGKVGSAVTFEDVLAVSADDKKMTSGKLAAGAKVTGKILSQGRHRKVTVLKYKTGGQYKIQRGHRQDYTAVEIGGIAL